MTEAKAKPIPPFVPANFVKHINFLFISFPKSLIILSVLPPTSGRLLHTAKKAPRRRSGRQDDERQTYHANLPRMVPVPGTGTSRAFTFVRKTITWYIGREGMQAMEAHIFCKGLRSFYTRHLRESRNGWICCWGLDASTISLDFIVALFTIVARSHSQGFWGYNIACHSWCLSSYLKFSQEVTRKAFEVTT